jgi:hypothetical protein
MAETTATEFPGPMTEREMEWARILVNRRLDEKKTEEVRAIFDRLDNSHSALRDLLRRVMAVECFEKEDGSLVWGRVALSAELRAECEKVGGK